MTKEQKFYNALKDIFVGAKVEGESGFINLMRIKSRYYEKGVFPKLQKDIEESVKPFPEFKEELFDKLYTFFNRYFSESGSIYFRHTPIHQNIYEKVYTDDKDVMLFWKTHMLYYVKTDRLFKNLEVDIDGYKFFFDVSTLEHKRANEKRQIIYEFKKKRGDNVIVFNVYYSERGKKTKVIYILRALKKENIEINEDNLLNAFRIFEKQNEVDYFINKNAKEFLKEQFDIWLYQYVFTGESEWTEIRIKQLQVLKNTAFNIIDFISQFEDELVKIWNKPKFVLNSNYVITLDRIANKNIELVEKILNHSNFDEQIKEWKDLGIVDASFNPSVILSSPSVILNDSEESLNSKYKHLPIDTKHFKDLELEILSLFDNLDNSLDGWLIKSENYQALNTILPKFKEKVQTIYIDPPFNKEADADYFYSVKYKDASWITLLENRLQLARDVLNPRGSIFVRCDYNGNMYIRLLMNEIFEERNFRNEIIVNRFKKPSGTFTTITESFFFYSKSHRLFFNPVNRARICTFCKQPIKPRWHPMSSSGKGRPAYILGKLLYPQRGRHWTYNQESILRLEKEGRIRINEEASYIDSRGLKVKGLPEYLETEEQIIDSNWTDITGYKFGAEFQTENSEEVIKRVIESTSNEKDIVMDFFLGSGTTTAVAHKLKRKWLGVEMGEHFYTVVLPRMKKVLASNKSGISKEVHWQGGGFFKYYELEQYEDTLRKVKYEDSDLFDNPNQDPYNQYVFMRDLKMLSSLEIDYENNTVNVDLSKLYPDPSTPLRTSIDIPETLSNLLGRWIKKITADEVEFSAEGGSASGGEDGEKIDLKDLDYKLIKPLIWW
ncbi:MAG: site-specific DNA-methyltransferase [Candidatus Cloacimonetes bacterium]|nr:site-specific DNA-methyltransferase [Candidatus Cloacimonadota bacterium]